MNLNIKAISTLNPGQTPVDVSDCPVDALTKEAQFRFPEHISTYFAMLGGLHMSNACWLLNGQFIERSGLREILEGCSLAIIAVSTVVDVNQIKRARYCVQLGSTVHNFVKLCTTVYTLFFVSEIGRWSKSR